MRFKCLFLVVFIFQISTIKGQHHHESSFCHCIKTTWIDTFALDDISKKVVLISFEEKAKVKEFGFERMKVIKIWDWQKDELMVSLDSIYIKEKKALNKEETKRLFDVLYGVKSNENDCLNEHSTVWCYLPRQGMIFYNSNDVPFAYYEFCLECKKTTGSSKFYFGDYCEGKLEEIVKLFREFGFKYNL